jgi:SRSO17 transposase
MGQGATGSDERFAAYIRGLSSVIGHADRFGPLRDYCVGLVMPAERKSVEPMAALTAPARVAAQHQSLLHFVGEGGWSDEKVLAKVRELVLPKIERHGLVRAWIIDDTGMPKQGRHSVGVARQYCGQLGKQDNCQVAVSLSLANAHASLPVAYRLYLPQDWIDDAERRRKVGVPDDVAFMTKPQIALEQIRAAHAAGLPKGVVLMDAGYGVDAKLRMGVSALGLTYVGGVLPNTLAWKPGTQPESDAAAPKKGRRDDDDIVSLKEIALALPKKAWRTIEWREGTCDVLASRFARVRTQVAHRHTTTTARADEWLFVEWPKGETEPTKYWLSTLPEDIDFVSLVDIAKLRWRIERDYHDLKQEVGLGHYEGRGWRGFHHHATLCIAAYGFLISEREAIPPSGPRPAGLISQPALPKSWRPRGAATAT